VWHAANIVAQLGTSADILNIDGTETTGTATPNTTAGKPAAIFGAATDIIYQTEGGFVDNLILSGTQRSNGCANQAAFYGTPTGVDCP
jgi:hypothetical protein